MTHSIERPLGRFELAQILTDEAAPLNAVVVVRLRPGPLPADLDRALRCVRNRHPLLRARLRDDGGVYSLASDGVGPIPVERCDRGDWRELAERELGRRIDVRRGPLVRLVRLDGPLSPQGDRTCDLVFTFQHVIMDATSAIRLIHEILTLCGAPGDPGDLDEARLALPPIEERFPPAWQGWQRRRRLAVYLGRQMVDEMVYRRRSRGVRAARVASAARNRILTFRLPAEVSRPFLRRSRRQRVSVASALNAAALLALLRQAYDGRAMPMRYFLFPNLRPYLRPAVPDEDLGSCFVLTRLMTWIDPARGFWELAGRVHAESAAALRRGDKFAAALAAPAAMRFSLASRSRMGHVAISYTGSAGLDTAYGALGVEDLHAFVANLPHGPEWAAQVRLAGGELCWDAGYLDTDFDTDGAVGVAEEIRRVIAAAVDLTPGR